MSRGFLKDIGGTKRMRFVKPGYDANNLNVPPNAVIFDSEDAGGLFIYRSGSWSGAIPGGGGAYIATWPSLGYTPLGVVQNGTPGSTNPAFLHVYPSASLPRFTVYPGGLWLANGHVGTAPDATVFNVVYQIYRLRVQ